MYMFSEHTTETNNNNLNVHTQYEIRQVTKEWKSGAAPFVKFYFFF